MFILKGKVKDEKIENFIRKDGTPGTKRSVFIDTLGSIYPVKVNVPMNRDYGQVGSEVEIAVNLFPYCYVDKQRQRAFLSIYVPEEVSEEK